MEIHLYGVSVAQAQRYLSHTAQCDDRSVCALKADVAIMIRTPAGRCVVTMACAQHRGPLDAVVDQMTDDCSETGRVVA